jgi:hypothetical protein
MSRLSHRSDFYGFVATNIDGIDVGTVHGRAYSWAILSAIQPLVLLCRCFEGDRFQDAGRRQKVVSIVNTLIRSDRLGEQHPFLIFDGAHSKSVEAFGSLHRSYFSAMKITVRAVLGEIADVYLPDWYDLFPTPGDALGRLGILPDDRATVDRIAAFCSRWELTPAKMLKELWRIDPLLLLECRAMLAVSKAGKTETIAGPCETITLAPLQQRIIATLNHKALKKQPLADVVCAGEGTRLYKPGGIKELVAVGLVAHANGVGYYRPDAPPQNLVVPIVKRDGTN